MKHGLSLFGRRTWAQRAASVLLSTIFIFSSLTGPAVADEIRWKDLAPGTMVGPSKEFVPVMLKGLTLHPDDPLHFEFLVDSGSLELSAADIKRSADKLVRYFMSGLTIPKSELWVNLSPYEGDRIITSALSRTELGQDLLIQDYLLKQLTSTLIYPEADLGEKFWERVYAEARRRYGITELPVETFNKVWILPDEAVIAEHGTSVEIIQSGLKVMLDEDYLAMKNQPADHPGDERVSELSARVLRELIVPEIAKEVNTGENFAALRQIYHSLILAKWYKETITDSLLTKVYIDQQKVLGVDRADPDIREKVYQRYLEAFQKGVFDYVREEYDPASQEIIPRKYFSGGITQFMDVPLTRDISGRRAAVTGQRFVMDVGSFPRYRGDSADKAVLGESGASLPLMRDVRLADLMFLEAQRERRWKRDDLIPLAEAVDAMLERFALRDIHMDRGVVEDYLTNTPGYPVEGNRHLAKSEGLLTGISKGLEGVGVGRATFFEREDVQFQYPFVAPNNDQQTRDEKVANEKRLVGQVFEGRFRELSELSGQPAFDAVTAAASKYIQDLVEQRMVFAYRLVHELLRKSNDDIRLELGLGEEVSGEFLGAYKKELLDIYIPELVEAHADSPTYISVFGGDYGIYQRLKLTRGAWAVLLTHPYGLDRMREYYQLLEDYVRFQTIHDEEIRKTDGPKDDKRIARVRREMDRINNRLKTLHKEIEGLQRSLQAQQSMFFYEFLPKTLAAGDGGTGTNALAMIRRHMQQMDKFFEAMSKGGSLPHNMEAIKEAYTAFTFIQDHLDSHAYVTAFDDAPDYKLQKIRLEVGRFQNVMKHAREMYVREQLRLKAARNQDYNGGFYPEILKGEESGDETATALTSPDSLFSKFAALFSDFVEKRIEQRGVTIERAMINFMSFIHDDQLLAAAGDRIDLSDFAEPAALNKLRDVSTEFMMIFAHLLKEETTQQETEPMVVFIDPSIEALTPNEVGAIHVQFPNIVAIVEQGRSPHAINQFPLSVSGVSGISKANVQEGEMVIVSGNSRGLGRVLIRPAVKSRTEAYQFGDDLQRRREYYNIVAAKPLKVGGRDYNSFTSVGVDNREDLKTMNALGIPNVGLHRLELMFEDPYRPDLRNQEEQMAKEFERILNEEVFNGGSEDSVLGRYIPRIDDIGGEKIPQILNDYLAKVEAAEGAERREEVQKQILTDYSGTAFYFYRDAAGQRPFYEYGLRQLRALFRAFYSANNKRLGVTFPNVRVIEGVVDVDDILAMVEEAKQQVAAALFEEERQAMAVKLQELQPDTEADLLDFGSDEAKRREYEARVREFEIVKERLTYFEQDREDFIGRQMRLFEGVKIGFYVEDFREIPHYAEMVRKSDFIALGTNDMTQSLFRRDFPKLTRFDSRYSHLFDEMQPRLLEANWIMARVSARYRKPLLISGDWGDTVRWGGFIGTALSHRYDADVYPVSSISKAARIRAYMREITVDQLIGAPGTEGEQGILDSVFRRLEEAYAPGMDEFRDVLHAADEDYLSSTQQLRESLDPKIEAKVRELNEDTPKSDKAVLAETAPEPQAENVGGIDLNDIRLERREAADLIRFDPVKVQEILNVGVIDGFTPVIINVTPLPLLVPLAGEYPAAGGDTAQVSVPVVPLSS